MFFIFVLLLILVCILIALLPRTIKNYKLYKQLKLKEKRQEAFRKKMKELEIK